MAYYEKNIFIYKQSNLGVTNTACYGVNGKIVDAAGTALDIFYV